jgi:hypothetical protein
MRIAQRSADLELDFCNHAFRIDRNPASRFVTQHVVVLEITVQRSNV